MIINVEGEEKTGKSTFAYTAPLPMVVFSFDMGHERAIFGKLYPEFFDGLDIATYKYKMPIVTWANGKATAKVEHEPFEGHDITIYEVPKPMQMDPNKVEGFMAQWAYFLTIYVKAMQDPLVQTVVIDTATLLYRNKVDAYLEELNMKGNSRKQLLQIEYGHPNGEIRSVYDLASATGKNLVTVHHLRDHYVSRPGRDGVIESVADGTLETDGMKETARKVDIELRIEKRKDGSLWGSMPTCGPNLAMEGVPVPNPTWDGVMGIVEIGWYGKPFPRRKPVEG